MKKKIVALLLSTVLGLTSYATVFAEDTAGMYDNEDGTFYELADPSKLVVIDGTDVAQPRVIVGTSLFNMTITNLFSGELLTTHSSGKSVKDSDVPNSRIGIQYQFDKNNSNKIGLCTLNRQNGSFVDVGSTTVTQSTGVNYFNVSFPNNTAYGFVSNRGNSSISGTVRFYSVK